MSSDYGNTAYGEIKREVVNICCVPFICQAFARY